ncbi:MAG: hypothetical protein C4547_15730 [Phycisphaerales bacterium]|nr:MAG: hypothetical protein C4547_15730 [Phycisphaerales bacterium]
MTILEKQVRAAQHRLWVNRWFDRTAWCLAGAVAVFAAIVLVQRSYGLLLPVQTILAGIAGLALLVSIVWTAAGRESADFAAARLDEAAGLRERISSGRYCVGSDDPFAQAVLADATEVSARVSVRQHLRYTLPQGLGFAGLAALVAVAMFLIPLGWMTSAEAGLTGRETEAAQQTHDVVKKRLEDVIKVAETNPALEDLKADLEVARDLPGGQLQRPEVIRHEAIKKLDKLADAVKKKTEDPKYASVDEFRRMMRGLQMPKESDAPTQKLSQALAQGDFKTAQEEIKALQEQLATLKSEEDKEMVENLSNQLEDLAKQIEKVAQDKQMVQKLEQAGVKKEDVERMLENLSKKDLEQVKQQLAEKGMSQQQIEQLAQQLQQKQMAGSAAKQMAQAMQQASQCNNPGQMGEAMQGLSQAADQMSNMEALEAEMNQLQSTLDSVQDAQQDLSDQCSQCNGTGQQNGQPCGACNGTGQCPGGSGNGQGGMGQQPGQGRGGMAPEEKTDVAFQVQRQQVKTGKGAIVGQFLVDGEQHEGEVSSELVEIVTAAERDATDAVTRDRVPRQYQKAVKDYFSIVRKSVKPGEEGEDSKDSKDAKDANDGEAAEKSDAKSDDGATGSSTESGKD